MNNYGYNQRSGAPGKKQNTHLQFLKLLGIMLLLVAVITTIVPRNDIEVDVGDDALTIICLSGNIFSREKLAAASVRYESIDTIECVDAEVRGSFVSGYAGRRGLGARYDAGIWNEPAYGGNYDLILREDAASAIRITETDGHTIVFNFESTESTNNLYKALLDYLGR